MAKPKVQGIYIISDLKIDKSALDDLTQQIIDAQKAAGHVLVEECKVVCDNGVGNSANEDFYAYGRIRDSFADLGGHEVMKRAKKYPFRFPGGASGQFYVVYEYRE